MKIWITIVLTIILINNSFAQNSITLGEGEVAPFSGHLVKSEKLQELIKSDKKIPLLEAKFELQEELITYHKGNASKARSKAFKEEMKGNLKLLGGFVLGVIITGFAFKLNKEIVQ